MLHLRPISDLFVSLVYRLIMRWSNPIPLSDYSDAPAVRGVYEIGFGRAGFEAKYLGRALGPSTSIRSRLSSHYRLNGSKHVNQHNRDGLYVRWIRASEPDHTEANLLQKRDYAWNERTENYDSD